MDFRKLEYFIAAVEEESFAKAAEKCYISQTAISQQIASMEQELGVQLFNRQGYRSSVTQAGRNFYESSKKLILEYETSVSSLQKFKLGCSLGIKIGLSGPIEINLLPAIIRRFEELNPTVEVELKKRTFAQCVRELKKHKFDVIFGIDSETRGVPDIDVIPLFNANICVITSLSHYFSDRSMVFGNELKNERLIVFSKEFSEKYYNSFLESCRNDGFEPEIVRKVDTLDEMILLVSSGKGIAVISDEVACNYRQIRAIPLKESHHKAEYCIVRNKEENKVIDEFVQCVLDMISNPK